MGETIQERLLGIMRWYCFRVVSQIDPFFTHERQFSRLSGISFKNPPADKSGFLPPEKRPIPLKNRSWVGRMNYRQPRTRNYRLLRLLDLKILSEWGGMSFLPIVKCYLWVGQNGVRRGIHPGRRDDRTIIGEDAIVIVRIPAQPGLT